MKQFSKDSTIKDYCESIKENIGKYIILKTKENSHEGWLEECIEDPENSDDIILKIRIDCGHVMIPRYNIKKMFEFIYGYEDCCVYRPDDLD